MRPVGISDLDVAVYIALIREQVKQAHTLLDRVKIAAAVIGLMASPKKTNFPAKYM